MILLVNDDYILFQSASFSDEQIAALVLNRIRTGMVSREEKFSLMGRLVKIDPGVRTDFWTGLAGTIPDEEYNDYYSIYKSLLPHWGLS